MASGRPQQFGSSYVPGVLSAFSNPMKVIDGGMKSTAMFRASTRYMTKQAKLTGTDGLGTEVDNLCNASLLRWTHADCNGYGVCDAGTIGQRLTLPSSLSRSKAMSTKVSYHM